MIGQRIITKTITDLIENNTYPRFSILVGQKGSGKKMLCNNISKLLNANLVTCDIKVDAIRSMIENAYRVSSPTLYLIADGDSMSGAAKNAMLKVLEEPPQNAYFILTLCDLSQTLDTIKSRGTVFHMDSYTPEEILEYAKSKYTIDSSEIEIIVDICETPLEVDIINKEGILAFYDYVLLVVDNIAEVSGSNSFKIADKLAFKDEEDKYNLLLFWKAFMKVCTDKLNENAFKYSMGIKITSKYLQELMITGINRQSTFDMWLLHIREEWME